MLATTTTMLLRMLVVVVAITLVAADGLDQAEKYRCEQYTSIFENDSTRLQYEYCENIYDGRGYTAGRAGFCTGTGDAIEVIMTYTAYKPANPLAAYIPRLAKLAKKGSGDTRQLKGYCRAWRNAAQDTLFRLVQDYVSDQLYYLPAMAEAERMPLNTTLGRCAFYDAIIQHGGGHQSDSLQGLIRDTQRVIKRVLLPDNEHLWVLKFLQLRAEMLAKKWRQPTGRVEAMFDLIDEGNWHMSPPMNIVTKAHNKVIY